MRGTYSVVALSALLVAALATPIASAAVTANAGPDRTVDAGQSVTFDGTASSATGESIASYNWDFGDGTTGSGATVSKTFTSAGTYTVTLIVVGTSGGTSVDTASVVVRTTDTSAPNITHTPVSSGTANSAITVNANVTDNIGILAATLFYKRSNESTYQSTTMSCTGSATSQACNASIPSSVTDGSAVNYYLRATDTKSGTPNTGYYPASAPSSNLTITLTDTAAPSITHTVPSSATAGSTLNITATIADTVAVDTAKLFYDFNESTSFSLNVTMTRSSGSATNGSYYATISGASLTAGATLKYYIQANDTSNNVARTPTNAPGCFGAGTCTETTIGVSSASAPTIFHTPPSNATAGQALTLSITLNRTFTSGIVYYRSLGNTTGYNGVNVSLSGGSVYTATLPAVAITDRGIEYFVNVTDTTNGTTFYPSAGISSPVQLTTPPGTPTGTAVSRSASGVTVTWSAPATDANNSIASYKVYRSVDNSTYASIATVTAPTATYLDSSAIDGVQYYYRVSAVDNFSTEDGLSTAAYTTDKGFRPAMPAVSITAGNGQVTLSWTGNAPVNGWYNVSYATTNGSFTFAQNVTVTNASATFNASIAGLTNGVAIVVRVLPFNPYNESGTGAFVAATPTAPATGGGGTGGTTTPTTPTPSAVLTLGTMTLPSNLTAGQVASITATVQNTGTLEGSETATLVVDGVARANVSVTVPAGSTRTVTLTFTPPAAGTFQVSVRLANGQTLAAQTLTVAAAPVVTPTPTPTPPTNVTPTPSTPVTTTPTTTTPVTTTPVSTTPVTTTPTTTTPRVTTPTATTPATTTATPVLSATPTPTPSPTKEEGGGVPGFELVPLVLAALAAAYVLRRRT